MDGRPNRRNKAAFSCWINVDGRPNRGNKAPFANSYGVVSMRPNKTLAEQHGLKC